MKVFVKSGVVVFLLMVCVHAKGQNFGYKMIVGANFCQIDGDNMGGYNKLGYRFGFGSYVNTKKEDEVGFEITYTVKGSRTANNPDNPPPFIVRYNYSYLEVPLYFTKKLKNFGLKVALAPAFLVAAKADLGGGFTDQENVRPYELSAIIGPSYQISSKWYFYAHYQYSLLSIIDHQKSQVAGANFRRTGVYNNIISAGLAFQIK